MSEQGNLPHTRPDGMLRRQDSVLLVDAERKIIEAQVAIERLGAHPALTDAVKHLTEAHEFVADYLEGRAG